MFTVAVPTIPKDHEGFFIYVNYRPRQGQFDDLNIINRRLKFIADVYSACKQHKLAFPIENTFLNCRFSLVTNFPHTLPPESMATHLNRVISSITASFKRHELETTPGRNNGVIVAVAYSDVVSLEAIWEDGRFRSTSSSYPHAYGPGWQVAIDIARQVEDQDSAPLGKDVIVFTPDAIARLNTDLSQFPLFEVVASQEC